MIRKTVAAALAALCMTAAPALAQQYPSQPINVVIPFAPGGSNDIIARLADQIIRAKFNQPLVIQNKPGAGGNIGALQVAQAKPDGYTLLVTSNVMASSTLLFKNAGYDPITAFSGIMMAAETYAAVIVPAKSQFGSMKDVIAEMKRKPGEMTFSSGGVGSSGHVAGELLGKYTGAPMRHIPYSGGGPTVQAALSGEVTMAISPINNAAGLVASGDMKVIALTEKARPARYPNIEVIAETAPGVYVPSAWVSVFAPKGTPHEIVELLSTTLRTGMSTDDMKGRITAAGFTPVLSDGPGLEKRFAEDHEKWKQIIPELGLKAE